MSKSRTEAEAKFRAFVQKGGDPGTSVLATAEPPKSFLEELIDAEPALGIGAVPGRPKTKPPKTRKPLKYKGFVAEPWGEGSYRMELGPLVLEVYPKYGPLCQGRIYSEGPNSFNITAYCGTQRRTFIQLLHTLKAYKFFLTDLTELDKLD